MKKFDLELVAGFFLLIGIICLGYLSVQLGELDIMGRAGYTVFAEFDKAGGIKPKAVVEMAGVPVGTVKSIGITEEYRARVEMTIDRSIKLQDDAIASVKTKGLIGEQYIQISPGGSEELLTDGSTIRDTESAIDIEEVISKYVFGKV